VLSKRKLLACCLPKDFATTIPDRYTREPAMGLTVPPTSLTKIELTMVLVGHP
jgi:hypothetical protein